MSLVKIKKRNGTVVAFDRTRIEIAIEKATSSVNPQAPIDFIIPLTNDLVVDLEARFAGQEPGVEQIQDAVEKRLMEDGMYEIARAYILYRERQAEERKHEQEELLEKMEKHELMVTRRNGEKVPFDNALLLKAVKRAVSGYESEINAAEIVEATKSNLFDGVSTSDIDRAAVMTMKARIERAPAYSYATARMFLNSVYKEVCGEFDYDQFEETYKQTFIRQLKRGVDADILNEQLLTFDLEKMADYMKPERDQQFAYLGIQTLYDRYFIHINKVRIETPQAFWMRVAMGLAIEEDLKEERAMEFYDVLSKLLYVSSTPTLFNSGTTHSQLSSCYLSTISDDLGHIFKCLGDDAQLSKWAGGLGNDWTQVRATGSKIKGTNGESQGVIPFLKIANDTAVAVNQGGKRKGALCSYLESWHLDIEDFMELRKNTGDERRRTHDMNTANWIPDLFMKRVLADAKWTLFSPNEVPELHDLYGQAFEVKYTEYEKMADEGKLHRFKRVEAKDLWRKMLTMLFETGHPWITFKDVCNIRSPQDHVGVVHSSNLCTEITLNTSAEETAVCNLGSVNLKNYIVDGQLDKDLLKKTIRTAMRLLDNVIDINFYPTKEAENSNRKHRPVGMGIMGYQDALYKLDLDFASDEAVQWGDELMEFVSYCVIESSALLAQERGAYSTYKGSKWDRGIFPLDTLDLLEQERGRPVQINRNSKLDWGHVRELVKLHGMRNSNCMAIAPTATISNIAGCVPCIEPIYKNLYVKSNLSGEFTVINNYLIQELKDLGLWNSGMSEKLKFYDGSVQQIAEIPLKVKAKYKEVFEIEPQWFVKHTAARGKWIDQAQSTNIFIRGTSGKVLNEVYTLAWEMGLKTTYYLRSLGISQVEKSTVDSSKFGFTHKRSTEAYSQTPDSVASSLQDTEKTQKKSEDDVMCSILNGPDCEACQ